MAGRPDRLTGDHALGKALWSPQKRQDGNDIYRLMREVRPGDVVFHFVDNRRIAGVSLAASSADPSFVGLPGTEWANRPAYRIALADHRDLEPGIDRDEFLQTAGYRNILDKLLQKGGLFFNRKYELNQGSYLTEAPRDLVDLWNRIYEAKTGKPLPYTTNRGDPGIVPESTTDVSGASEPSPQRVWLVAPGEQAEYWDRFFDERIIAIGWDAIGDLRGYSGADEIRAALKTLRGEGPEPTNDAKGCYEFAWDMQPGDLVFAKKGRSAIVGYGYITSEYIRDESRPSFKNVRRVDWKAKGNWVIGETLLVTKTVTNIGRYSSLVAEISEALGLVAKPSKIIAVPYSASDAKTDLFVPEADVDAALAMLKHRKNLVLQGPPGVGKTFVASRLAFALMEASGRERMGAVQFHQSYSYEDFVQGYRPVAAGGFERRDGIFLRFCRKASSEPSRAYVFLIDEINRGNLSKILGELMLLIESDKRSEDWAVPLAYAADGEVPFWVPPNVHLIGTMNTADRSLAMVDYALRRRFGFVTVRPAFGTPGFERHLSAIGLDEAMRTRIGVRFIALNRRIAEDTRRLGPGFEVGHSYFCAPPAPGESAGEWFARIVKTEVAPLMDEYWFDDPARAKEETEALLLG